MQNLKRKTKAQKLFSAAVLLGITSLIQAQGPSTTFPFDDVSPNDESFNATININSSNGTTAFNNLLLGSNVDINTRLTSAQSVAPRGSNVRNQGFAAPILQDHLNETVNDPVVIRFPQGVWANVYNWQDFRDADGNVEFPRDTRIARDPVTADNIGDRGQRLPSGRLPLRISEFAEGQESVRLGYPALRGIFDRAAQRGRPLDLLTVLSITQDNVGSSVSRVRRMRSDGFTVRDMELGNEFFFLTQRSNTIDTEEAWRNRAKRVVEGLREDAPNEPMRFAIPISFRAQGENNPDGLHTFYNREIVGDQSFFDAIVVHRYVRVRDGSEGDENSAISATRLNVEELRSLLSASETINSSINFCQQQVNPDKRNVWLTEWGVAGGSEGGIGASYLGTANTYIDLMRRDDIERVNFFSTFGLNAQYEFPSESSTNANETGFGRVYQVIRDATRDNEMFNDVNITAPRLSVDGRNEATRSINAIAIRENGGIKILAVNMTNEPANIVLRTNTNRRSNFSYESRGVRFETLQATDFVNIVDDETSRDVIRLEAFSITAVDVDFDNSGKDLKDKAIRDETIWFTAFPNPSTTGMFTLNQPGNWEAYTLQGVKINSGKGDTVDLTSVATGLYLLKVDGQILKLAVE